MTEKRRLPRRIQCKRTKGWRKPAGAVYVGRPTGDGNEFRVGEDLSYYLGPSATKATAAQCVEVYASHLRAACAADPQAAELMRKRLGGHDLMCWCHLCQAHEDGKPLGVVCTECAPCHVDPLLEIVNGGSQQ